MLKIGILALDNCMYSSVTSPMDIFSVANMEWEQIDGENGPFCEAYIVSPDGKKVTCFNGLTILAHQIMNTFDNFDIIITPVLFGDIESIISRKDIADWLKVQHKKGACICSVCAGAFLAAEAGLLKGRSATTHWKLAADFRKKYPDIDLKPEKMLIDGGDYICAGGITAYLDLCLYITSRFGSPELASTLSKLLLIDSARQAQLPYQTYHFQKSHGDKAILKAQEWLDNQFTEKVTIRKAAAAAGLGERTFARRFKKATGETPLGYCQIMRIEAARKMLETTDDTVEAIANNIGYDDISSFRRILKQRTGMTPSAYRKKFSSLVSKAIMKVSAP